jgi:hypothetical protein
MKFLFIQKMACLGILCMDAADDGKGAGGGAGKDDGKSKGSDDFAALKAANDALMARLEKLEKGSLKKKDDEDDQADDEDLSQKAKKQSESKQKESENTKALESAIVFTTTSKEWVKTNASLLPKDVQSIFDVADKETYDNSIQKASAIKSGVVQQFFKVQDNLDLLTNSQKIALEDWLKLTKNGKEEKAQQIFDNIFEPTFEMLKRIKRAEQVNKSGQRSGDDAETAYKQKLMQSSRKHFMGSK